MSQTGCKHRNPGVEGLCPFTAAEDVAMPSSWHGGTYPPTKTQPQLNKHCPGQKVPKSLHTSLRLSFHPSEQVKAVLQTSQAENKHLIAQAHQTARKSAGTHRWSTQVKKTGSSQCHQIFRDFISYIYMYLSKKAVEICITCRLYLQVCYLHKHELVYPVCIQK